MKTFSAQVQIGKEGLSSGILTTIRLALKNHKQVRVSVLRSATRDRVAIKEMVRKIEQDCGVQCSHLRRMRSSRLALTKPSEHSPHRSPLRPPIMNT